MDACRNRVEVYTAKVRQGRLGRRRCHYFLNEQAIRNESFCQDRGTYE